ncbi:hypothetical protein BH23PLA1_BH23PLA1_26970 [soil metagenome]
MSTVILVCPCGKRINAPGAMPGRVGSCPACGGRLIVPDSGPARGSVHGDDEPHPFVDGHLLKSDSTLAPPRITGKAPGLSNRKKRARGPEPTFALVRPPTRPETSLGESFRYPFWDGSGLTALVMLPPALTVTTVIMAVVLMALDEGGAMLLIVGFAVPMIVLALFVLGYCCLVLGRFLMTSAWGEVLHPLWPRGDVFENLNALGRWAWATLIGGAIGGLPALVYWMNCGPVDWLDRIVLVELAALGAAYAQMALVGTLLHEDILATNPLTVFRAIARIGWEYLRPCLVTGASVTILAVLLALASEIPNGFLLLLSLWLIWVVGLYLVLVSLRVLGLCYFRNADRIGWFRERPRWGATR